MRTSNPKIAEYEPFLIYCAGIILEREYLDFFSENIKYGNLEK